MRILFIEDDKELCSAVAYQLQKEGYTVDLCYNGEDGLYFASQQSHDMLLLDRMLPGMDGLSLLKTIRKKKIKIPVIMITALNGLGDKIDGLDCGADDYISKPFDVEELKARIRALARRPIQLEEIEQISFCNLTLDCNKRILKTPFSACSLSKKEADLMEYFIRNKTRTLTREQILVHVWGPNTFVEDGNIDNYIHFLRRRLKGLESTVRIKTIHSIGYRLEETE